MLTKSKNEAIREIAAQYNKKHGDGTLEQILDYALSNDLYAVDQSDITKLARRDFRNALKERDDAGRRVFLSCKKGQTYIWNHRELASWQMRQSYINEQAERIESDKESLKRDVELLNSERKSGEPEFQCHLFD